MSQVDLLYRLQQIDSETRQKKARLAEVLRLQKESASLLAAGDRAAKASANLKLWQARQQDLNLELTGLNSHSKQSEDRLYSGKVKNTKELSDLQKEIESLARRRAHLEDEIIEVMIALEDAQAEQTAAADLLQSTQAAWDKSQKAWQQEQQEVARRLADLAGPRQEVARLIQPNFLAQYDDIGRRPGGLAVAALKDNRCQGCQVTVSAAIGRAANLGEVVTCGSCGRILHSL